VFIFGATIESNWPSSIAPDFFGTIFMTAQYLENSLCNPIRPVYFYRSGDPVSEVRRRFSDLGHRLTLDPVVLKPQPRAGSFIVGTRGPRTPLRYDTAHPPADAGAARTGARPLFATVDRAEETFRNPQSST